MQVRIKAIDIHAFRGIPDLELELNGKSLLVKGENGTGKSSIVEAMEFFFTGKLSYFEGEGTKTLSLRRHVPHKNFGENDANIKITFNPDSVSLCRTFENQPSPPKQFGNYFQVAQRGTFILRRMQILKFITSTPSNRFRAIASIIGIEPLDDAELEMKRLYEELDAGIQSKRERISQVIEDISKLIGKDISESTEVLSVLNNKLQKVQLPTIKSLDEVDKSAEEMLKTFREPSDLNQIMKLNETLEGLKALHIDYKKLAEEICDLNGKVELLLQNQTKRELSIRDLLIKGQQAIEADERDICPLCGQPINREELLKQINKRLQTLSKLSDEASEIRRKSVGIEEKLNYIIDKLKSIASNFKSFPALKDEEKKVVGKVEFLEDFVKNIKSAKELEERISVHEFDQNRVELKKILDSSKTKCQRLLDKIGVPEDWKEKLNVIRLIEQVKSKTGELTEIQRELVMKERYFSLAKKIYFVFSETKKAKITAIYNAITVNLNAFYSMLHPNDPHKNLEINVSSTRRASTELKMESFGRKNEDPRAFTSEGHQDSLGLCIFLAFVKKFNKGCNLVVLDDVVSTIDAQHRELICKLLFTEFKDYQLIITTHDEVWYEQLRSHQRAYGIDGDFRNLEIIRWEPDMGPVIEPYKSRWERIQEKINSSDKVGAGVEGRIYLEGLLKQICEATIARVPFRRNGKYMVSDLWYPVKKRFGKLVENGKFKAKVLQQFQELDATIIMANLLLHDNPLIDTVSIKEVERFCKSIHELDKIFRCPQCGSFLRYYEDLKIVKCSKPKCKNPIEISCH